MFGLKWLQRLRAKPTPPAPPPNAPGLPSGPAFDLIFGQKQSGPVWRGAALESAVFVGNCIAETMANGLASLPAVSKQFDVVAVPLHLRGIADPDVQQALRRSAFVFVQGVARGTLETINALRPPESEVVMLPDAVLRSVWPFDAASGYRDDAVRAVIPNADTFEQDWALGSLRDIEPDKRRRLERYRELDFPLASRVDRIITTQERFLEDIDRDNDVHLGRFISRHFRDRQLFYNSTHPSEIVFRELCEFAWRKLGLKGEPPAIKGIDAWRKESVPVHPMIAKRLGLTWVNDRMRYTCRAMGPVTWEEWATAYIDRFG